MTFKESGAPAPYNRPPYHYVDGDASLPAILTAAGLDPVTYGSRDYIADKGMTALWELFSDGELRIFTEDELAESAEIARTSGAERYGEFFAGMSDLRQRAALEGGPVADEVNKLARFCGRTLAEAVFRGAVRVPDNKMVRPGVNPMDGHVVMRFDDYRWRSSRPRGIVLEYGPGVGGKRFVDAQLDALTMGMVPYQYLAISDGPFVNQFLMSYLGLQLEGRYGPGARDIANSGRLLTGREDGMSQATAALLDTPQPSGSHEMCDAILLTGLQAAEPSELEFALAHSPQLLRSDGNVFISSPIEKKPDTKTTFSEQLAWALDAGLKVVWQKELPTGDTRMGTDTISGLVVLEK